MAVTATDYLRQAQGLLPFGPAWQRDDDAPLTRLLDGLSLELARLDARALNLLEEADPRITAELLADWERVAGLPDTCSLIAGVEQNTPQRQAALTGRMTTVGGQTPAYFIGLAATLGYTITITEFKPHDVEDGVDAAIYGIAWQFAWQVNAALNTVFELHVTDTADDPLAAWSNAALECLITAFKPAHTVPIFSYT